MCSLAMGPILACCVVPHYREGSEAEKKLITYPQTLDKEEIGVRFEPGQSDLTLRLLLSLIAQRLEGISRPDPSRILKPW